MNKNTILIGLLVITAFVIGMVFLNKNNNQIINKLKNEVTPTSTSEANINLAPTKKSGNNTVPLPQEKDIINNFFQLIDEGKVSDAVMMMPSIITNNDSTKQAFGVQFSAMKSVKVIKIEESMKEDWTETRHQYMVTLDVVMDPSSAGGPIPYYGFERGENVRFVGLVKEGNQWKVEGMATGP